MKLLINMQGLTFLDSAATLPHDLTRLTRLTSLGLDCTGAVGMPIVVGAMTQLQTLGISLRCFS